MKLRILIVEDQYIEANNLKGVLTNAGYAVCTLARTVEEALQVCANESPDLVLIDIILHGRLTGIDLARALQQKDIPFIFLSANSNEQIFNEAKETTPYGFLVKPFRKKDVLAMVDIASYTHKHRTALTHIKQNPQETGAGSLVGDPFDLIIGNSQSIKEATELCKIVAPTDTTVLILGESGTGKELIAKMIHHFSDRSQKPLVVVNCATLNAYLTESALFGHEKGAFTGANEKRIGKFEEAEGGTIFLDEIGELTPELQIKFLRVLQEMEIEPISGKKKKIDVRVIAATNKNLEAEVAAGTFRMDLFYRLNVFLIDLPPLRERLKDIPLLAMHFLKFYANKNKRKVSGFSPAAIEMLKNHHWPGNVRELENLIARSVLMCQGEIIEEIKISNYKSEKAVSNKSKDEFDRELIVNALTKCKWKIYGPGGAGEMLQMNSSTLRSQMKKLGIERYTIGE
jgi:DNA-binding NtrC family response regulator